MDKRIANAEIRRVWMDPGLTTAEAAAEINLSRAGLWKRAKNLGLPPRKEGRPPVIPEAELRVLWLADVLSSDIAALYRCPTDSVRQASRRIGLDRRPPGRHLTITMAEYRLGLIRKANTPGSKLSDPERRILTRTRQE